MIEHLHAITHTALAFSAAVAVAQETPSPHAEDDDYTLNVAIVVHEGVELLDFAGPGEVFEQAGRRGARDGAPAFRVYTVAPSAEPIVSQDFLRIVPEYSIHDSPKPDILVVPGGSTQYLTRDRAFMSWARDAAEGAQIAFSVCTGAFVFAQNGQLDGLHATTHRAAISSLRSRFPSITVHENVRFVDNGQIVTTAGISAGIDGALHVVARLLGTDVAEQVAGTMEYRWEIDPRYADHYSTQNPRLDAHGQLHQRADALRRQGQSKAAEAMYRDLAEQRPDDGRAWYYLGLLVHTRGDLDAALPLHEKAAMFEGPLQQRAFYNIACVHALQGHKAKALDYLGKSIEAGFDNRNWIEHDADLESLRGEPRYRELLERLN